ncbi:hypothetical protein CWB85_19685 [Pseudoalteromonas sp. S1727]|uniref:hypothetical protein n=1 Tax=Pseudoalteromonas sp. S1727 TaxID=2066514 RepID=UPI0011099088|nr:hypothetical protein [Pseudoalteromonas sp. S1727]TMN67273.1 hypothetical protein CWB85_19685 [Pseudoalteromonas sp. S1727]
MTQFFGDHMINKLIEGDYEPALTIAMANGLKDKLESGYEEVWTKFDQKCADHVFNKQYTERALNNCIAFCNKTNDLTQEDFIINCEYAQNYLKKANIEYAKLEL